MSVYAGVPANDAVTNANESKYSVAVSERYTRKKIERV